MNESQADLMLAAMGLLFCFIGLVIYAYSRLRYKQYRRHTQGVISHQYWKRYNGTYYPMVEVSYRVKVKRKWQIYTCQHRYNGYCYNQLDHPNFSWMVDRDYNLHFSSCEICKIRLDPFKSILPLKTVLTVYYNPKHPEKAYCGVLKDISYFWQIYLITGIFWFVFGILDFIL